MTWMAIGSQGCDWAEDLRWGCGHIDGPVVGIVDSVGRIETADGWQAIGWAVGRKDVEMGCNVVLQQFPTWEAPFTARVQAQEVRLAR